MAAIVKSGYQQTSGLKNGFSVANGNDLDVYWYANTGTSLSLVKIPTTSGIVAVIFDPIGDTCARDDRCTAQRCVPCKDSKANDVCVNNIEFHRPEGVCHRPDQTQDKGLQFSLNLLQEVPYRPCPGFLLPTSGGSRQTTLPEA